MCKRCTEEKYLRRRNINYMLKSKIKIINNKMVMNGRKLSPHETIYCRFVHSTIKYTRIFLDRNYMYILIFCFLFFGGFNSTYSKFYTDKLMGACAL